MPARLSAARALCALALFLGATLSGAQEYPSRTVRVIIPFAAGGQPDVVSRSVFQLVGKEMGQAFVIENITGAGGVAANAAVLNAPADGHTLYHADVSTWAINPALRIKGSLNAAQDIAPVRMMVTTSLILVVNAAFPANTIQELVAAVRAKPGFYNYGSSGIGSVHHLTMESFKVGLNLNIVHIPYKGSAQSLPALMAGDVSMLMTVLASVAPFEKSGRVKILAVNTKDRTSLAPHLPPMADAGIPDFDYPGYNGIVVRAGTPRPIVDKLAASIGRALAAPEIVARFKAAGIELSGITTTEAMGERMKADLTRYIAAVKMSGITPD